jgi:hypothetical protein
MDSGVPTYEIVPIKSRVPRNSARIGVIFLLDRLKTKPPYKVKMDISGNPVQPPRPGTPLPKLVEGIKTIGDIFKRMESNTTLESFVDAGCAATGVGIETKPLLEAEMELPVPATREDNIMTLKQQFGSLAKFKDVPMTYAEMRARYG